MYTIFTHNQMNVFEMTSIYTQHIIQGTHLVRLMCTKEDDKNQCVVSSIWALNQNIISMVCRSYIKINVHNFHLTCTINQTQSPRTRIGYHMRGHLYEIKYEKKYSVMNWTTKRIFIYVFKSRIIYTRYKYWSVCCQLNMVIDLFEAQYVVDDLKINNDMLGWKRMLLFLCLVWAEHCVFFMNNGTIDLWVFWNNNNITKCKTFN